MASDESGWDAGTADPALIQSMIQNESAGNPRAVSPKGARGLMQIMPSTAAQYGVKPDQLFQPKENQWLGTHYYNQLLDHYQGNPFLALVAYHSGPGRVDKGILLPESVKFASKELTGAGGAQSVWQKIKGSMAGGTAYAQEPPGQQPAAAPQQVQTAPTTAGAIPIDQFFQQMGQQQAAPPPPPPMPQTAAPMVGGGLQPGARETIHFGPFSKTVAAPQTPQQATMGQLSAETAQTQMRQLENMYDTQIAPEWAKKYGGSLATPAGRRSFAQPWLAQHSRYAQAFGLGGKVGGKGAGLEDPELGHFYDIMGPGVASQVRALLGGGRLGYFMVTASPLTPHLPSMDNDSLPRMREKLGDLTEYTLPTYIGEINKMRAQGFTDDQIISHYGGDPNTLPVNPDSPAELPQGFQVDQ